MLAACAAVRLPAPFRGVRALETTSKPSPGAADAATAKNNDGAALEPAVFAQVMTAVIQRLVAARLQQRVAPSPSKNRRTLSRRGPS